MCARVDEHDRHQLCDWSWKEALCQFTDFKQVYESQTTRFRTKIGNSGSTIDLDEAPAIEVAYYAWKYCRRGSGFGYRKRARLSRTRCRRLSDLWSLRLAVGGRTCSRLRDSMLCNRQLRSR